MYIHTRSLTTALYAIARTNKRTKNPSIHQRLMSYSVSTQRIILWLNKEKKTLLCIDTEWSPRHSKKGKTYRTAFVACYFLHKTGENQEYTSAFPYLHKDPGEAVHGILMKKGGSGMKNGHLVAGLEQEFLRCTFHIIDAPQFTRGLYLAKPLIRWKYPKLKVHLIH